MKFEHDHIHLTTQDVDGLVRFYVDNFGADIVHVAETFGIKMVNLDAGGAKLRISNMTGVERHASQETGKEVKPPEGFHHYGFLVENVDAAMAELGRKGARVEVEAEDASPTLRCGFMMLPGNVRVEIAQPLG